MEHGCLPRARSTSQISQSALGRGLGDTTRLSFSQGRAWCARSRCPSCPAPAAASRQRHIPPPGPPCLTSAHRSFHVARCAHRLAPRSQRKIAGSTWAGSATLCARWTARRARRRSRRGARRLGSARGRFTCPPTRRPRCRAGPPPSRISRTASRRQLRPSPTPSGPAPARTRRWSSLPCSRLSRGWAGWRPSPQTTASNTSACSSWAAEPSQPPRPARPTPPSSTSSCPRPAASRSGSRAR